MCTLITDQKREFKIVNTSVGMLCVCSATKIQHKFCEYFKVPFIPNSPRSSEVQLFSLLSFLFLTGSE